MWNIARQCNEYLVRWNRDVSFEPWLLESVSSDFTRRHDGHPPARRRRRRASARTSPTTRVDHDVAPAGRARPAARGPLDARDVLRPPRRRSTCSREPPCARSSRLYRRWAYESAALDLALRQAGRSLHEVLGREPRPVTFVVSLRLGEPATLDPVRRRLDRYPTLRFKLDPTSDWTRRARRGAVRPRARSTRSTSRASTRARSSTSRADPALYRTVVEAFPDAWIEDPTLTDETQRACSSRTATGSRGTRNIHSIADIEGLPFPPRMVNVKPSRFGGLRALSTAYDYCAERGIGMYGGGQFELGPGRGQIQYLAVAVPPRHAERRRPRRLQRQPTRPPACPSSPLDPRPSPTGFRWGEWIEG